MNRIDLHGMWGMRHLKAEIAMLIRTAISVQSGIRLVLADRQSGVHSAMEWIFDLLLHSWELVETSAVTISNLAIWMQSRSKMHEMSEKPIHRILNLVSLLALIYYAASSINSISQSDAHIYNYDNQSHANWSTAQLEAHRSGK